MTTLHHRPRLEPKRRYLYPQVGDVFIRRYASPGIIVAEVAGVGHGHVRLECQLIARGGSWFSVRIDNSIFEESHFRDLADRSIFPGRGVTPAFFYPAE